MFIYERQKHIRFVRVPPSHSEHSYSSPGKSFNFNYIWTFLWAKQWNGITWAETTIKCTTGHLHGKIVILCLILRVRIFTAQNGQSIGQKSNLIAMINKVIKIGKNLRHEWDGMIGLWPDELHFINLNCCKFFHILQLLCNKCQQLPCADPALLIH